MCEEVEMARELAGSGGGVGRDEEDEADEGCAILFMPADAAMNPGESEREAAGDTARRLSAWCA